MFPANEHTESWCLLSPSRRLSPNGTGAIHCIRCVECALGTSVAGGANGWSWRVMAIGLLGIGFLALAVVLFGYRRRREVTARADAARWAHRDALTGLPDRVVFHERMQSALDRSPRGRVVAVVIDIDGYRVVNASYGHRVGDDVLTAIAERLHAVLGSDDLLVRLAGDQFGVLGAQLYDERHPALVADPVRQALVRPSDVDGEKLWLTACIGVPVDASGNTSAGA